MLRRRLLIASGVAAFCVAPAFAQETMRVRATVEKVDGATYMVKARDGTSWKLTLTDKPLFVAISKASMADVKPGMFIGTTAVPQADGTLRAVEVHIFPEAMRGTGEGHRPWDLQPQATMTNANVETSVAGVDGDTLSLKYKDGEKKVTVTKATAVVTYVPGNAGEVKAGTHIFVAAQKMPDGSLRTARITYGKDGLVPPM